tara:strand:+ start:10346 stop:11254 length:909 start_codon:yes stop_codon:yes gene_type:complete
VSSDNKFKKLIILEYGGTGYHELTVGGTTSIELENYPNAVYLSHRKSVSKNHELALVWVESPTSSIKISIDENFQVTFESKDEFQEECNQIFKSARNIYLQLDYRPAPDKPIEPTLVMEAKLIKQNLEVQAKTSELMKLYDLSQKQGIYNWATDILSSYLKEPFDQLYDSDAKKLIKVRGLDSLENEIEIRPDGKKHLLIATSGSWCGPCIKGLPKMREVYNQVNEKVLFVSTWNDPNLETFNNNHKDKKQEIIWPNLWDPYGITAKSIHTQIYPSYVLFDPNGIEVKRWDGKFPGDLDSYL